MPTTIAQASSTWLRESELEDTFPLLDFDRLAEEQVLVEPLSVTSPAHARGCMLSYGTTGVVRVLRAGRAFDQLRAGDTCIVHSNGTCDRMGYLVPPEPARNSQLEWDNTAVNLEVNPVLIRGTCLARLPPNTRYTHEQWAEFAATHVTAFANWRIAHSVWRLQVHQEDQAVPHVWGWDSATTRAELELAKLHGARATLVTADTGHADSARACGVEVADANEFPNLALDERQMKDSDYRARQKESDKVFQALVRESTDGNGISIFLDYHGGPLFRPALKALAREGVFATGGWGSGARATFMRAIECIERHQLVSSYYARARDVVAAIAFAEHAGWMPLDAPAASATRPPSG